MTDVLELFDPEGAFERVEEWLAARGFFQGAGEGRVADLYLGYGLGEPLRRRTSPAPPEPCALPVAACAIRPMRYVDNHDNGSRGIQVGSWEPTWSEAEYAEAVDTVRGAIERGEVYQVNLVQHLSAPFAGDPVALAPLLAPLVPLHKEPFSGRGWSVVSASPELFLARRGGRVRTSPVKGTRPAGRGRELTASAKDAAEHVMIVDLERNDLSRVCEPGTVRWPELMATRGMAGVDHMVSTVEGTLRKGVGLAELLRATFPGGSVTGAPKIAAIDLIAELEPVGRGCAMGAIGRVHENGDLDLALTIRTFAVAGGRIHLWVGGGVVWDSSPEEEVAESWTKARPLLEAIGAPSVTGARPPAGPRATPAPPGSVASRAAAGSRG